MHDDRSFQAHDVIPELGHAFPPSFLEVALQIRAQRAIIPKAVESTINLRRLENEPTPFGERNDFLHQFARLCFSHRRGSVLEGYLDVKMARNTREGGRKPLNRG